MHYKVSVIIPVYNVENFIRRCAESLLHQSLEDIELIFVDDGSPDNSVAILKDVIALYPNTTKNIKILHHPVNKGLPSARNSGLAYATGEYIYHCDSDDWLEHNALEVMYNTAVVKTADIVWSDWYLSFEKNERYMSQSLGGTKNSITSFEVIQGILGGKLKYNVWNKLVRRELYLSHNITFPDGYGMGEDMTMIKLFVFAKHVEYIEVALYHYLQINNASLTKQISSKHWNELMNNVENLTVFLQKHYPGKLNQYLHYFKLSIKLPLLITNSEESYKRWNICYCDSHAYIWKNPFCNFRTKLIQHVAMYQQYWFLKLYNTLITRFVYGFLYK